jgi:hypothetical protein
MQGPKLRKGKGALGSTRYQVKGSPIKSDRQQITSYHSDNHSFVRDGAPASGLRTYSVHGRFSRSVAGSENIRRFSDQEEFHIVTVYGTLSPTSKLSEYTCRARLIIQ